MDFTIEHVGLPARDPKTLADWYEKTLGAIRVHEDPPAYFLRLAGGLIIEIYQARHSLDATSDNSLSGWRHLALRVTSLAETRSALSDRGLVTQEEVKPAGGGGQVLFYRDPEGNLFHLVERPIDSIFG